MGMENPIPKESVIRVTGFVQTLAAQAEVKLVGLGREVERAEVEDFSNVGQTVFVTGLPSERDYLHSCNTEDFGVFDLADRCAPGDEDQIV